jgi:hypothetical protein
MTEEVQQAIIKILAQGSFEILRPNRRKKGYWRAGDTKNLLPRFCKAVKGAVANARQRDGKGPVKVSLDDR